MPKKVNITNTIKITWNNHEVDVPVTIVNKLAYAEWYVLDSQMKNAKDRYWKCDNGEKVDLTGFMHHIKNKMLKNNCLTKDIEKAKVINGKFSKVKGALTSLKRKFNSLDGRIDKQCPIIEERFVEIIDLFGRYYTESEVFKIVNEEWNTNISFNEVRKFAIQNKDRISELRKKHEEDYSDISIHSKRSQLGKLNYLLQDRMQHYEKKPSIENSREIRAIIMDAVKIVNGNQIKLDISGKIDIEATLTINIEYQQNILKGMTLQQIVLSRVAAKLGVNPVMIMSRLAHSYYAKFNGYNKNNDLLNSKPIYPSSINYDFEDMGVKFSKQEALQESLKELPTIQEAEVIEDISAKIMRLIKEKKQKVEDIRDKNAPRF